MSSQTTALPKREEMDEAYTWDLKAIFQNEEAWEEEFAAVQQLLQQMTKFEGTLGDSSGQLYEALAMSDTIEERLSRVFVYAHMRYDQDTTNSYYQGLNDRAERLASEAGQAMSFLEPEILSIPEEKIQSFLQNHEGLALYKHALDELNQTRAHVLSPAEESLLAKAAEVTTAPANTFGLLNNADLNFPVIQDEEGEDIQITHGRLLRLLKSDDREVRKSAFFNVYQTYKTYENTFAGTLSGQVKRNLFYAKARNYSSAREAALSKNHIPEKVYDQLVETVNEHLHLLHRYVQLRKRVLKVDELHPYDLYTTLVKDADMDVTYERAQELIVNGLAPLGDTYVNRLKEGFQDRWIDVYENEGKRSGAYSSGAYGTKPYILMNWQDDVNSLFTLAHELGHSLHSYYTNEHQPSTYSGYTIFVAEVASTLNEMLLNQYLLEQTENIKQRMYLLNHFLEDFRGTVFRQTMFAEFEQLIHEKAEAGVPLTPDQLNQWYYELNEKYFGPDLVVDEDISLEWARIPHFYMNFYVYQYATGFSAAAALSKQVLEEGQPAVERYLSFISSGRSNYSIDLLKKAGVDMTEKAPIEQAMKVFEETLEEMERLIEQVDS
ncbi:oligopeptidase F [Salsuginibacillus halophilus]|uniref:Oligopeptidase F n=1 Tax=Salsuginibacillus halophilus TaxID=517424 RepID=A0A2P8HXE9_9BACI|nr:oligoendopeptidase F [Salsuginibacillus halophilus]PSL50913.1 oligopeptidase F [Salsuginibacillus halophilus]